jgi:mono/diheme cytochrome c family protein
MSYRVVKKGIKNLFGSKSIEPRAHIFARLILAAFALFAMISVTAQGPSESPHAENSPSARVENGKKIYERDGCYECHGRAGQGSRLTGPKIGPQPIPFSAFVTYVRAPKGQMPPYTSKVITDAELADIYSFLKSLPQPSSAKDIPLLNY